MNNPKPDDDIQGVKKAIRAWRYAVNAGDAAALLALADNDIEIMLPGQEPVRGAAAHKLLRDFIAQNKAELKPFMDEEIVVFGEWAMQRHTYEITETQKARGAKPTHTRGHGIHMFRRQRDGSWKVSKDVSTVASHKEV